MATTTTTTGAEATTILPSARCPQFPNEQLWSQWEERLAARLEVDFYDTCRTHTCPYSVQLIVHLDVAAAALKEELDAVASLCMCADRMGSIPDAVAFWSRIAASCMVEEPLSDCEIDNVARYIHAHGMRVVLSWTGRVLENDGDFASALRGFLHAPRLSYVELLDGELPPNQDTSHDARPVQVGLRFVDFELTASQLQRIVNVLTIHEKDDKETEMLLCEQRVLRVLHFEGTPLGVEELEELARGLESSPARRRRVDELRLENVVTSCDSFEYVATFQRVLTAAFQSQPGEDATPLVLSLGRNKLLKSIHIEALQRALASATRPLGGLALDRLAGGDDDNDGLWSRVGRIVFSPVVALPLVSGDCDLDLSSVTNEGAVVESLCRSLRKLVAEQIPAVSAALENSIPVYCQVRRPTEIHTNCLAGQLIKVLRVQSETSRHGSSFLLETTATSSSSSVWVPASSIASLRIGDVDVVRCRFTSLSLCGYQEDNNDVLLRLIHATGAQLQRLTLRRRRLLGVVLEQILDACPLLQELNLSSSDVGWSDACAWNKLPLSSLRVLNLHYSELDCAHLESLFAQLMLSHVRVLVLGGLVGEMRASTLRGFLSLLQANPALEYVKMPKLPVVLDHAEIQAALVAIDTYMTQTEDATRRSSGFNGKLRVFWGAY